MKFSLVARALGMAIVGFAITLLTAPAYAQINSPVPISAYIVYDGLDWAWGGPCPYSGGCYATGNLTYQGTQGWALPTAADMAIVDALDGSVYQGTGSGTFANLFLDNPGGNVPPNGTDPVSGAYFTGGSGFSVNGSCASPYFNGFDPGCDRSDGANGLWAGSQIAANSGVGFAAEQLYVRSAIPEPSTWAMMLLGFMGFGYMGYRRTRTTVSIRI